MFQSTLFTRFSVLLPDFFLLFQFMLEPFNILAKLPFLYMSNFQDAEIFLLSDESNISVFDRTAHTVYVRKNFMAFCNYP
jgi:hypothetical protein